MGFRISPSELAHFYPAAPAADGARISDEDLAEVEEIMERLGEPESVAGAARILTILALASGAYSAWAFARWGARWQSGQRLGDARRTAASAEEATREVIQEARSEARQRRDLR